MNRHCPVCDDVLSTVIFRAARQPAILNHLFDTRDAAINAAAVELEFRGCESCGFVWNAAFDPNATIYAPGYINDQSCSMTFNAHLEWIQVFLCDLALQRPGAVVEIGCGQGDVLQRVCTGTQRRGIGFDPAFAGSRTNRDVTVHRQPFNKAALELLEGEPISLVYARHVLEHVPEPLVLARLMRSLNAAMYLEVPTIRWIAEHRAFYDLFNEHCSLFTTASMQRMLRQLGFDNLSTQFFELFDRQYLGVSISPGVNRERLPPKTAEMDFASVNVELQNERQWWNDRLFDLNDGKLVLLWGAGAKGVSFLNHLGLTLDRVPYVVDIHPLKQSKFVPITGQRVIAPQMIREVNQGDLPIVIIIMNPAYEREIRLQVEKLEINASFEVISNRSAPLEVHC